MGGVIEKLTLFPSKVGIGSQVTGRAILEEFVLGRVGLNDLQQPVEIIIDKGGLLRKW